MRIFKVSLKIDVEVILAVITPRDAGFNLRQIDAGHVKRIKNREKRTGTIVHSDDDRRLVVARRLALLVTDHPEAGDVIRRVLNAAGDDAKVIQLGRKIRPYGRSVFAFGGKASGRRRRIGLDELDVSQIQMSG